MTWDADLDFLASNWTCIWGAGCVGIGDAPAEELGQGCCSIGAELLDDDEAMLIGALAASIDPELFENHDVAAEQGVFADATRGHTKVHDGACIFFNKPGFIGGTGCALHLAAEAEGERPLDWKPSVCWQLPFKVDRTTDTPTLRPWQRTDWGTGGQTMAWCCTERNGTADAYVGDQRVIDSLADEIEALVGHEVFVDLKRRVDARPTD